MLRSAAMIAFLAATFLTTGLPALAQSDDAELRDLTEIAKNKGITVAEARRRAVLEQEATELNARLEKNPNFSGLRVVSDGQNFRVDVSFTANAAAALKNETLSEGMRSVAVAREGGRSVAERNSARGRIIATLARLKIKASLRDDFESGKLVLTSLDAERARAALGSEAANIEFVVADDPAPRPAVSLEGGRAITVTKVDGTGGGCSTAFGVSGLSTTGILTAGHCHLLAMNTNMSATPATATTQGATLTVRATRWTTGSDFLYATGTGHVGTNRVWDGQFARAMTSTQSAIPALGASVCKYGNVTRYSCQTVTGQQRTWLNLDGTTVGPLVELTYENSAGNIGQCGDSGGAVFYGNRAYGVISRADDNGPCAGGAKLWYSEIKNVGAMGVTVLIQ